MKILPTLDTNQFKSSNIFDLTKEEADHLRLLWAEPQTRRILEKCFKQQAAELTHMLYHADAETPFLKTQAQLAILQQVIDRLESTAQSAPVLKTIQIETKRMI